MGMSDRRLRQKKRQVRELRRTIEQFTVADVTQLEEKLQVREQELAELKGQ